MYTHCGDCAHYRWNEDLYDDGTYIENSYCTKGHVVYSIIGHDSTQCEDYEEDYK